MKFIRFERPDVLHYGALHLNRSYLDYPSELAERVTKDLNNCGISLDQLSNFSIIIDFRAEGQCDQVVQPLVDFFRVHQIKKILVVFNTCVDVSKLNYPAISWPTHCVVIDDWFDRLDTLPLELEVDTKFLCLMRRPSPSRARLAAGLLDIESLTISFGSMCEAGELVEYQSIVPAPLPIQVDGLISRELNKLEHDQTNPMFRRCLFNVVAESSSQLDPGVWRSIFITEKSFKPFGLRQIPIWAAVPGLVAEVRKLGFDVFDDIVDHSYDNTADELERHASVIQQVHQLDKLYTLEQCATLRQDLAARLDSNYQRVKQILISERDSFKHITRKLDGS